MKYLRQSTASIVAVGPFLAAADGKASVTTLTIASTLNGRAISNGAGAAYAPATFVHDANGYYLASLAAGDVPGINRLRLNFADATTYCPVWEDFTVYAPAIFDAQFGTAAIASQVWTDTTAGADFATAGTAGNLLVGGLVNGPGGIVAAGSSTTTIVVTGNSSMTAVSGAYATATVLVNGQFRKVAGHTFSAGAHTFTLGTGTGGNGPLPTGLPVTGSSLTILAQ